MKELYIVFDSAIYNVDTGIIVIEGVFYSKGDANKVAKALEKKYPGGKRRNILGIQISRYKVIKLPKPTVLDKKGKWKKKFMLEVG
jgi:hypothetical protein